MTFISLTLNWKRPNHELTCSAAEVLNNQDPSFRFSTGYWWGLQWTWQLSLSLVCPGKWKASTTKVKRERNSDSFLEMMCLRRPQAKSKNMKSGRDSGIDGGKTLSTNICREYLAWEKLPAVQNHILGQHSEIPKGKRSPSRWWYHKDEPWVPHYASISEKTLP